MKFDDVRTVQFWPPFVPRAHPPYARMESTKWSLIAEKEKAKDCFTSVGKTFKTTWLRGILGESEAKLEINF